MNQLQIRFFQEDDCEKWDNFLKEAKCKIEGNFITVYSTIAWKRVLEKTFGYKSYYILAEDESTNQIKGIFPLMLVKSRLFGDRLMSLPFTDYGCGPITIDDNPKATGGLLDKADEIARELKAEYLRVHPSSKLQIERLGKLGFTAGLPYHGFIFKINMSNEEMWVKKFTRDSKIRNIVRKAEKNEVKIKVIDDENLMGKFYKVYLEGVKMLGTPPYKKDFFLNILREFKENGSNFFFAEKDKEMISIAVNIPFCESVYVVAGGMSLKKYRNLNPLTLLYWESIKMANKLGFKEYDFGGSRLDSSQQKFKEHWNTSVIDANPMYKYYAGKKSDIDPRTKKFEVLSYVWRKFVPPFIAKIVGNCIRKQIGI